MKPARVPLLLAIALGATLAGCWHHDDNVHYRGCTSNYPPNQGCGWGQTRPPAPIAPASYELLEGDWSRLGDDVAADDAPDHLRLTPDGILLADHDPTPGTWSVTDPIVVEFPDSRTALATILTTPDGDTVLELHLEDTLVHFARTPRVR